MPRLNARGQAVMGVGNGIVSVDGVRIVRGGGGACWLSPTTILFHTLGSSPTGWVIAIHDVTNGFTMVVSDSTGANELAAGGGRWLAWEASRGVYGSITDARAGLTLADNDGRGAAGEDGTLGLLADRQTGLGLQLHAPSGGVALAPPGTIARQVHILGPARAIWRDDAGTLATLGLPLPVQVGPAYGPRWVDVPGATPWVCYWTPSRLVAHPIDSTVGVLLATGDNAFYHDARVVEGRLVVAYALHAGELPGDLIVVPDAFQLPTMELAIPTDPEPDQEPDPDPEPEPEPEPDPEPGPPRQQVAFGPNLGSNIVRLFTHPEEWEYSRQRISAFQFYVGHILSAQGGNFVQPNTWDVLRQAGVFRVLKQWGVLLELQMAQENLGHINDCVERITGEGGSLGAICFDHSFIEVSPEVFSERTKAIQERWPTILIGAYVPYPTMQPDDILTRFEAWDRLGGRPDFLRLDIDYNQRETYTAAAHEQIRAACQVRGVSLQCTINAKEHISDAEWVRQGKAWFDTAHSFGFDAYCVQSWASTPSDTQRTLPHNLPESDPTSHTALLRYVLECML